ncbi:MAG: hypothetical protein JXJ04_09085 [Spirochaetales bacterium]|nr:hypothetical protein [Spirochaetales bacterium]
MSLEKSIILKILELTPKELKSILTVAIHLLYIDGIAEIEEWNILSLIPALLDVIKEDTPKHLKQEWKQKLKIASKAIEAGEGKKNINHINSIKEIKNPEARKSCLLLLFALASSDRNLHKKELKLIIEDVARPWDFSKEDLIALITEVKKEIHDPETLITMIRNYK